MSMSDDYRRGLEKLGLYGAWNKGVSLQGIPYETSPIDLRTDPAFAWQVLDAFMQLAETDGRAADEMDYWNSVAHSGMADALYRAVCELGRQE